MYQNYYIYCKLNILHIGQREKMQSQNNVTDPRWDDHTINRYWSWRSATKLTFLCQIVAMNHGILSQTDYCRFSVSLS